MSTPYARQLVALLTLSGITCAASQASASDDYAPADGGPGNLPARSNGAAIETSLGQRGEHTTWAFSLIMALELPAPSLGCIDPTSLRCITRFRFGARPH